MRAIPFSRFATEVLEVYKSEAAPATYRKMRQALGEFAEVAAKTSDMDDLAIVRWKALHPGRSSWTARSLLISYRRACNLAIRKGYLGSSPFGVRTLDQWAGLEDPGTVGHHSLEAIGKVLGHLRSRSAEGWREGRLFALCGLIAFTGVRAGEALHARVEDFDLEGRIFTISPRRRLKTRASAAPVAIPPALAEVLGDWFGRVGSDWAFPGWRKAGPWAGGAPGYRPLDQLKARALEVGVPGFTFQSLRHSWATHAESAWGLSDPQIQRVLRHTTIRTSKAHYRHPDHANLRAIAEKVAIPIGA